jgi:hypothetical protein
MGKQRFYREEELKKYYLSPYTDVYRPSKTQLMFKRHDTGKMLVLSLGSERSSGIIMEELENGIGSVQAIEMFGDEKVVSILLDSGVLE